MSGRILLLSIRPGYAKKIFEGIKNVELRRTCPRISKGDLVVVYASSPRKALVGTFEVKKVIQKPLEDLWSEVQEKAGISYEDFCFYYKGLSVGCGIFLSKAYCFNEPVELARIREEWNNFRPPQSYRYLTPNEINIVRNIADFDTQDFSHFYQLSLNIT